MTQSPDTPTQPAGSPADETERESMRARHQVRLLAPEEEGSAAGRLPNGVYGWAYAPGQPEVPLFGQRSYHSFEFHKAADGVEYLLGYLTTAEAFQLEALKEGAEIQLFPDPWQNAQTLVRVPASRIAAPQKILRREDGNPFHFTIA